jgi:thiol-disulfide isomerase/thioredoxin
MKESSYPKDRVEKMIRHAFPWLLCWPLFATGLPPITLAPVNEAGFQSLVTSHKGKVVVYDFWATWCAPCRAEFPQLVKLETKLHSRGVDVITISADEPEKKTAAEKFIQQFGVQGPAYLKRADDDDHFANAIDPKWNGALPAVFLYDKSGRKVRSFIGATDMVALEAAINKLL